MPKEKKSFRMEKKIRNNFKPKFIFLNKIQRENLLFSLGFFVMVMASEILFNQPFKNKIKVVHNRFYKVLFNKKFEKIERIEKYIFWILVFF